MKPPPFLLAAFAACLAATSITLGDTTDTPTPLDRLKNNLPKIEKSLDNLFVESHSLVEQWDDKTSTWQRANDSKLSSWFDGKTRGRIRLDYHPQIVQWIDGAVPFNTTFWSIAYNGTYTQKRNVQPDWDETSPDPVFGDLMPDYPRMLLQTGHTDSARNMTLWGYEEITGHTVSNLLNAKAPALTVDETPFDGTPCIRLNFEVFKHSEKCFLDPAHGYALRGIENWNNGALHQRVTIHAFIEAAPGLFYPKLATREIFNPPGTPFIRTTITVSKAVINDPAFDYTIFDLRWSEGSVAYEGRTQSRIRLTGDFEKDNALLLATFKKAQKVPSTAPAR